MYLRCLLLVSFIFFTLLCNSQTKFLKYGLQTQKTTRQVIGSQNHTPLTNLANQTVTIKSFGKYLIIDFWFTKCGPCFREMPVLDKIRAKFSTDTSLLFVNICSISSKEDWKNKLTELSISGINLFDDSKEIVQRRLIGTPKPTGLGTLHDQLYLSGYPAYAFVKEDGTIMGATGVLPSDSILFTYYIEGLLNNKTIEESLQSFKEEIHKTELSENFKAFLNRRFPLDAINTKQIIDGYKKVL